MGVFLYIEDIRGDATEADHQGEIELESASFPGNPRGNQGQLTQQEIQASKRQDSASTALWKAAVAGEIFPFMILDFVHSGSTLRVTMKLVAIAGMNISHGVEAFSLNFETMSMQRF